MDCAHDTDWTLPESVERCPTCGRFLYKDDGYLDAYPGEHRGVDFCAVYCDADCADRKDPPALCEMHGKPNCESEEC